MTVIFHYEIILILHYKNQHQALFLKKIINTCEEGVDN